MSTGTLEGGEGPCEKEEELAAVLGEVPAASITMTSSFMPCKQWPGIPHMKYKLPVVKSGITVCPV